MKKTFALFFAMLCSTLFFTNKTLAAEYALQLCGIQVTDTNKDNITGPYITGHASYNPETNTLTLDNVSILIDNPYCALHNGIKDLTIYVTGDNLLWCSGGAQPSTLQKI